mgnify:CR=1 FL=1
MDYHFELRLGVPDGGNFLLLQTPRGLFDLSDQWIGDAADFEGSGKVVFTVND